MGGWHRLELRLDGPVDLRDRVDVELLGEGLTFRQGIDGVDHGAAFPVTAAWAQAYTQVDVEGQSVPTVRPGGMKVGETVRWMVERVGDLAPPETTVRVRAYDARRHWTLLLQVKVPAALQSANYLNIY